jgi:ATP-binding cassette subfamily B (MDR/TAP) protein 1
MTCFFGIFMGLFHLAMAAQNYKIIIEGKVAGKCAFDIIENVPSILLDDKNAKDHELEGRVEIRKANFYYPTRPDTKVLNNFSAVFEKGKTTALVGASGSGKSTIVQLIERFYDLAEGDGEILIDDVNLKTIKLRSLRQKIGYV